MIVIISSMEKIDTSHLPQLTVAELREFQDSRGQRLKVGTTKDQGDREHYCLVQMITSKTSSDASPRKHPLKNIQYLGQLRHPNIVSYLGFVETDTYYGIVTERVFGKSLREELEEQMAAKKHLPEDIIISWLKQLVEGLHFLHEEHSASHGNLDASQVLLVGDGTIKIQGYGFHESRLP